MNVYCVTVRDAPTQEGVGQVDGLRGQGRVQASPGGRDDGRLADEGLHRVGRLRLLSLALAGGEVRHVVRAQCHTLLRGSKENHPQLPFRFTS